MKNQWIEFLSGSVTVKIRKGYRTIHKYINKKWFNIWNVKTTGSSIHYFKMKLTDVKQIRRIIKESDCKVHFLKREGFPFFMKRLLKIVVS